MDKLLGMCTTANNREIIEPRIIQLVQSQRHVKLAGQDKLRVEFKPGPPGDAALNARIEAVRRVLEPLA